jgi:DegV family protein with EDD domain
MASYLIYTDAAVDLPAEAYSRFDIRVIPMDYMVNGESMTYQPNAPDRDEVCRALYQAQREGAEVRTSQITPFRFKEAWKKELAEGNDILFIGFSSGLSSTCSNAVTAAQELMEKFPGRTVRVVDSLAATSGQGVLVYTAGLNRDEQGLSLEENAAWLEDHVKNLCHRFTVGDLDYLHRGGRVSAAVALIGGILEIKPSMIIDDEGKLQVVGKSTGKHMALRGLVKAYRSQMGVEGVPKLVYVTHSANDEDLPFLKEKLEAAVEPGTHIEYMLQTPIIGVHTGPWFFSVCGWGKSRTI